MIAKLVIKLQNGGYAQRSYYTKTDSRKFRDLMSRKEGFHEMKVQDQQFADPNCCIFHFQMRQRSWTTNIDWITSTLVLCHSYKTFLLIRRVYQLPRNWCKFTERSGEYI